MPSRLGRHVCHAACSVEFASDPTQVKQKQILLNINWDIEYRDAGKDVRKRADDTQDSGWHSAMAAFLLLFHHHRVLYVSMIIERGSTGRHICGSPSWVFHTTQHAVERGARHRAHDVE
jgi:hypothetical protein